MTEIRLTRGNRGQERLIAKIYKPESRDVEALVRDNPFALLSSVATDRIMATPLPLLIERDEKGSLLLGHFGKANPHVEALRRAPQALAVFQGPHSYVSPSWLRDRTQAPTWNFATVHFEVTVEFDERPEAAEAAVGRLTSHMEAGRPDAWCPAEMGARYHALVQGIIAFRARIIRTHAKFKLGQNELPDVFSDILGGLDSTGAKELAALMRHHDGRRER